MKQSINESLFIQAFENFNRVDDFGYAGLRALFSYLEELEECMEEELELDVIALCCEWSNYDSWEEATAEYDMDTDELNDSTIVIEHRKGVLVQSF